MKKFERVHVWEEKITLPTYETGKPDKNPMFLEKRVYQGSSGKVYPHPVIDKLSDNKTDREYTAVHLENEFIKVMVLPEIGGRIQRATDKTNGYDFVYYNHVIKPALVGLAGPWISGGIEFNWPQHHRPSTFDPVDYRFFENGDGSATVAVGEIETMFRTKGMARFTLYPDSAYIEIKAQLFNRTNLPQTFLWWANPAVPANENTRSIFPPDVSAVMDHGKRAVSTFPIATGTYYKVDYSAGVDISRYKNLPVPTSYMAAKSDFDFVGSYDDGVKAGILHIADHHVAPGKKQWTWGCGDFGKAWDRNLTDDDGPYVELMTGCFTDNQPDFTWIAPMEEKRFTQYFMPYQKIGVVHNATKDLAMNFENGVINLYATGNIGDITVKAFAGDNVVFEAALAMLPAECAQFPVEQPDSVTKVQIEKAGKLYLTHQTHVKKQEVPPAATCPPSPGDCKTTEDLYLYGLHIEQYRHATRLPEEYYLEGLRRDPTDIRLNNAYGRILLGQGLFAESELYFRAAIKKVNRSNCNPYDSEPTYNLGLSLLYQNRLQESYDAFYKSAWSNACQEAAFYYTACICARHGEDTLALEHLENALIKNSRNYRARNLKALLLRRCGKIEEAESTARQTALADPLDVISRRILGEEPPLQTDAAIEIALEYTEAGFYRDAMELLKSGGDTHPMAYYHMARIAALAGEQQTQTELLQKAQEADSYLCFPHRLDDIIALEQAIAINPGDPMAHYYLGCLFYDKRRYAEAVSCWEKTVSLRPGFPTAYRNLALACCNKQGDVPKAMALLKTAFHLDETDARVLMEYDQLSKKAGESPAQRRAFLEHYPELIRERDDLYTEYITLLNRTDCHQDALDCLLGHSFHPWEGGEGKAPAQYVAALCALAKQELKNGMPKNAAALLKQTFTYPLNLGEGKLYGAQENLQYYLLGLAYEMLKDSSAAKEAFEMASSGLSEPQSAMYYNDQPPETIFCQGLALRKLGRGEEAIQRFEKLVSYGQQHENDTMQIDYFAVSLPDFLIFDEDLNQKNRVHCLFMKALGYLGLGENEMAEQNFGAALQADQNHFGLAHYYNLFMK